MNKEENWRLPDPPQLLQRLSVIWLTTLLCISILVRWEQPSFVTPGLYQKGLALLAITWSVWMMCRPFSIRLSFMLAPLIATMIWPLLQLMSGQTISRWETENSVLIWCSSLLAAFFGLQLGRTEAQRRWLLRGLACFGFGISLVSLLQYLSSPNLLFWYFPHNTASVFGPFISRNTFAQFAELVMPLCVFLAIRRQTTYSFLWVGMAATLFAAVIASASRAGSILMVLEIPLLALAARNHEGSALKGKSKFGLLTFVSAVAVFTAAVGINSIRGRFAEQDPFFGRRDMLKSSLAMIRDRPLMGVGLGNFVNVYGKYARFETDKLVDHAHNDWVEWCVDGGVPFVIFLVIWAVWLVPRAYRSIWGVGVLVVFVHGFVDFPLQDPPTELWVFVLAGALSGSEQ